MTCAYDSPTSPHWDLNAQVGEVRGEGVSDGHGSWVFRCRWWCGVVWFGWGEVARGERVGLVRGGSRALEERGG